MVKENNSFVLNIIIACFIGQNDSPMVTLENGLGVLQGKQKVTLGNLGVEPSIFYTFRNIPYAYNVSGVNNRYKVLPD